MSNPFRYFNSSPEVIRLVVMMYVRYPLSLRNVEDLLAERGIDISSTRTGRSRGSLHQDRKLARQPCTDAFPPLTCCAWSKTLLRATGLPGRMPGKMCRSGGARWGMSQERRPLGSRKARRCWARGGPWTQGEIASSRCGGSLPLQMIPPRQRVSHLPSFASRLGFIPRSIGFSGRRQSNRIHRRGRHARSQSTPTRQVRATPPMQSSVSACKLAGW